MPSLQALAALLLELSAVSSAESGAFERFASAPCGPLLPLRTTKSCLARGGGPPTSLPETLGAAGVADGQEKTRNMSGLMTCSVVGVNQALLGLPVSAADMAAARSMQPATARNPMD